MNVPKNNLFLVLIGSGIAFLILNIISELIIIKINAPSPYFSRLEPSLKTQTFKDYIKVNGYPSIITMGSSIADMGFNVIELDTKLKKNNLNEKSFNFGINGAGPEVFKELLEKVILKDGKPKFLIYGVSAIEFNESSKLFKADQEKFLASAGLAPGENFLGIFAIGTSLRKYLFAYLPVYRLGEIVWPNIYLENQGINWLNLKNFKTDFNGQQRVDSYWSDRIKLNDWPDWAYKRYHLLLDNYKFSNERLNTLNDINQICKKLGVEMIIVNMPVLGGRHAEGTEFSNIGTRSDGVGFQTIFETALQEKLRGEYLFINIGNSNNFQLNDFGDPFHLNAVGSEKLANILARKISYSN